MSETLFALPTEPLLEQASSGLRDWPVEAQATAWLQHIVEAPDPESRGAQLFGGLRDALRGDACAAMLRSLLGAAARGEDAGVLGLATMVRVRAPGEAVLDAVREFAHLHRLAEQLHASEARGESPNDDERKLLSELSQLDDDLSESFGVPTIQPGALPHPRDIGPAAIARRAFARIEAQLQERGSFSDAALEQFLRLCDLELRAHAMRSARIAQKLNPLSTRQLREVAPMLAALDVENRELREFLNTFAQERRSSLFFDRRTALRHHLMQEDADALLERCAQDEQLHPLRRILSAIERRPLPARRLGHFVERLYALGDVMVARRVRKEPIDLVEALLIVSEFADGSQLRLPAGERARTALAKDLPGGVEVDQSEIVIGTDEASLRRLNMPLGLPRYQSSQRLVELDPHESIKDLIMDNMNNTSILLGFLKNQKVVSTPGIVSLIVRRCRSMSVLDTICNTRHLYSGFANKDVPLELLKCPMRMPVKMLRRFINVRFVSTVDLRRLAVDRSSVRREVADEVQRYLKSLN